MKITNKDVCMVVGGAVIGAAVCGVTVVYKFISSETFGPAISKAAADKIYDSVVKKTNYRPYKRPDRVSYKSYYSSPRECGNDIVFEMRADAEDAVKQMYECVETYGQATVADLYEIAEREFDFELADHGWVDKNHFTNDAVVRVRSGWMIKLPKPMELI